MYCTEWALFEQFEQFEQFVLPEDVFVHEVETPQHQLTWDKQCDVVVIGGLIIIIIIIIIISSSSSSSNSSSILLSGR